MIGSYFKKIEYKETATMVNLSYYEVTHDPRGRLKMSMFLVGDYFLVTEENRLLEFEYKDFDLNIDQATMSVMFDSIEYDNGFYVIKYGKTMRASYGCARYSLIVDQDIAYLVLRNRDNRYIVKR